MRVEVAGQPRVGVEEPRVKPVEEVLLELLHREVWQPPDRRPHVLESVVVEIVEELDRLLSFSFVLSVGATRGSVGTGGERVPMCETTLGFTPVRGDRRLYGRNFRCVYYSC